MTSQMLWCGVAYKRLDTTALNITYVHVISDTFFRINSEKLYLE